MTKQEEQQCVGIAIMEILQAVQEVKPLEKHEQEALIIKLQRWLTQFRGV